MIDVLLATYRPNAKWLKEQVDSIRAQRGVEVNLVCREDAAGEGPKVNFGKLLEASSNDYVAFADQDDVWLEEKLVRLLGLMREMEARYGRETPLLVFCDGFVTDEGLKHLDGTVLSRQRVDVPAGLSFNRLLMQNFIAGNAVLFNAALRRKCGPVPRGAMMHDSWVALVAAAFGKIGFLNESLYLYRQHAQNALGAVHADACFFATRARQGVSAFRARLSANVRQAQAFVERFGDETPAAARALANLPGRGWVMRRCAILKHGLFKQGVLRNLALSLFV